MAEEHGDGVIVNGIIDSFPLSMPTDPLRISGLWPVPWPAPPAWGCQVFCQADTLIADEFSSAFLGEWIEIDKTELAEYSEEMAGESSYYKYGFHPKGRYSEGPWVLIGVDNSSKVSPGGFVRASNVDDKIVIRKALAAYDDIENVVIDNSATDTENMSITNRITTYYIDANMTPAVSMKKRIYTEKGVLNIQMNCRCEQPHDSDKYWEIFKQLTGSLELNKDYVYRR